MTGTHYALSNNFWHDNPGVSSTPGFGIIIGYQAASVGVPAQYITVNGDHIYNNGSAVAGQGLLIDVSTIGGGDVITDVIVENSQIINNNNGGIALNGLSGFSGLTLLGNLYSGSSQLNNLNANAITASHNPAQVSTLDASGQLTLANNVGVFMRDASGNAQPVISLSPIDVTFIRPGSAAANTQIQNFSGTPELIVDGGSNGGITLNNHLIGTGASPTLTGCGGGSPALSPTSTDFKGTFTTGTSATGCTVTFAASFATTPDCWVVSLSNNPVATYAANGASLAITFGSASGAKYAYGCVQ